MMPRKTVEEYIKKRLFRQGPCSADHVLNQERGPYTTCWFYILDCYLHIIKVRKQIIIFCRAFGSLWPLQYVRERFHRRRTGQLSCGQPCRFYRVPGRLGQIPSSPALTSVRSPNTSAVNRALPRLQDLPRWVGCKEPAGHFYLLFNYRAKLYILSIRAIDNLAQYILCYLFQKYVSNLYFSFFQNHDTS